MVSQERLPFRSKAKGNSVFIRFDGVSNHSTVWCNGRAVGERPYGYSSFTCDLTATIKFGSENVIAVRVDHSQYADSRWYAGSGIYRNVFLSVVDKVHVDTNGMYVTTPNVTTDSADIRVQTVVRNDGAARASVTVLTTIKDADEREVASTEETRSVPANGQTSFRSSDESIAACTLVA